MTGPHSAQMVLRDPKVDTAVLETARGGLLRPGLGYSSCESAVSSRSERSPRAQRRRHPRALAKIKRIVVEVARDRAVLNADDMHCLKMASHTDAERIAYFTMDPRNPLVLQHIQAGGQGSSRARHQRR